MRRGMVNIHQQSAGIGAGTTFEIKFLSIFEIFEIFRNFRIFRDFILLKYEYNTNAYKHMLTLQSNVHNHYTWWMALLAL